MKIKEKATGTIFDATFLKGSKIAYVDRGNKLGLTDVPPTSVSEWALREPLKPDEYEIVALKFYEFTGEYYALIKAFDKKSAIDVYRETVCDTDELGDCDVTEITMEKAWNDNSKCRPIEISLEQHIIDFVDNSSGILLVDTSLV
ncbi:hypothetical protein HCA00_04750 [Listeria booriae]|uniref:hypothetical protein n=1 Tax=Listeria booriae TaxID=1552123 RepID=UPI00164DF53A|nr:hypothetical protein [Listeria booriae]MBC6128092.1 hypothetical protein [Listeria booriae]